ncbi:MAG: hypothetical protein H9791_05725 [Candidatus Bacteroides intestinipullorum]|uniref:Lipoprotein n=1 Tax=Candidatus Bacteroides intestinipullorum TaxID=2838471 RepID=A0A9E2KGQ9_9BACE|nr:hypothetical protein [Candidatus Bacteroides intestinipullorum]
MKKVGILLFIALGIVLGSCSNEDSVERGKEVSPGTYSSDLLLAAEQGKELQISTRGLNEDFGQFTDEYPYNSIFIHSADDQRNGEGHQVLEISLQTVDFCEGCRGIHLEMEVLDDAQGGGYIIKNKNGQSITLNANDSVYFSTISSSYWQADVEAASPVTGSNVFMQDNAVNRELLRSAKTFSKSDLVELLSEATPQIEMTRHCTAFRVYFSFTNILEEDLMGFINESTWNNHFGEGYGIENFYIKLYLGPNFAEEYNVYDDDVTDPNGKGFYVTNRQVYQPFEYSTYSQTSGGSSGGSISMTGYGYETDLGNYLIAPLNTHLDASEFSVYVFVKHTSNIDSESEDFLTSDEGAKWFQLVVPSMTLETNRVHYIIFGVDYHALDVFKTQATENAADTRVFSGLEKMQVEYKAWDIAE